MGYGSIKTSKTTNMVIYSVAGIKDLTTIIIPHFLQIPLLTQKAADFVLFQQVVELMTNKAHLTIEGLHKILNIKASMNWGLSDILIAEFSNITPVERPLILTSNIPDPNWLAGFVTGEATFDVMIHKSRNKIGHQVQLRFRITQHERDIKLMALLIESFGSGELGKDFRNPVVYLTVVKFSDIINIIIPFFEKTSSGVKLLDYLDWCKIAKLMNSGSHLTVEGLDFIRSIKAKMNTSREF